MGLHTVCPDDIVIGIGDAPLRLLPYQSTDYWVSANDDFPIPFLYQHADIINRVSPKAFIYSDSVLYSRKWKIVRDLDFFLACDTIPFDQRHFNSQPCLSPSLCCNLTVSQHPSPNIQELFASTFNLKQHYSTGDTVAIHALAIAILMRPLSILIHGVDLNSTALNHSYFPSSEADSVPIPCPDLWDIPPLSTSIASKIRLKFKNLFSFSNVLSTNPLAPFHCPQFFSAESRTNMESDLRYLSLHAHHQDICLSTTNPASLLAQLPHISLTT